MSDIMNVSEPVQSGRGMLIYEDKDIIVLVKPYGTASQTERGSGQDMVSLLMNYFHDNGISAPYVGVVHRLDKNVGGVMVYAKNKNAAAALSSQIAQKQMTKKYMAVIYDGGRLEKEGRLTDLLIRDGRTNMSRIARAGENNAKKAELLYRIVFTGKLKQKDISVADITLLTGRHHQIRVQFASRGCPIVGDRKYGTAENRDCSYRQLGLFCTALTFEHPATKKEMTFRAKPTGEIFDEISII